MGTVNLVILVFELVFTASVKIAWSSLYKQVWIKWLMRARNSLFLLGLWSGLRVIKSTLTDKLLLQSFQSCFLRIERHADCSVMATVILYLGQIAESKWSCCLLKKKRRKSQKPTPHCDWWQAAVNTTRRFFHISTWGFVKFDASGSVSAMFLWSW